jgi:hypothetical protein
MSDNPRAGVRTDQMRQALADYKARLDCNENDPGLAGTFARLQKAVVPVFTEALAAEIDRGTVASANRSGCIAVIAALASSTAVTFDDGTPPVFRLESVLSEALRLSLRQIDAAPFATVDVQEAGRG